ncbi:MAG TPA: TolC family protein, partial [Arenimonas sp.]|nr:TolC family protein [Arenimonas sp.]
ASAELAQRLFDAGNISELQLKQEQAAASTARIDAAHARAESLSTRLALNTLLGLSGPEAQWRSGDRLPLPVPKEDDPEALLQLAREHNLELQAARRQLDIATDALGLARGLRWLGCAELEFERERETGGEGKRGPGLALELPIFHQQQARMGRARGEVDAARAALAQADLAIEHGVRLGSQRVQELAKVVATYRDALVPQRETIVQRSQQEYNFMLIGAFELISAKLEEYDAYQGYLEAVRDYWLARVDLMRAVGRTLPSDATIRERTPDLQDILSPPDDGGTDHSMHGGH